MSLAEYTKKRKLEKTQEPKPDIREKGVGLPIFVIQKHDASHLHYDLRLEFDGVLKSWAVPKGPSLKPASKKLAMMVEDHPFDYRDFEGVIPTGSYGAGTVMIWDQGIYLATGAKNRAESENLIRQGLKKGHISFVLNGDKLKGEFALVKLKKSRKPNAWLLIKADDFGSSDEDILKRDRSVASGKSMIEISNQAEKLWNGSAETDFTDLPEEPMPQNIKPMLATLVKKPFDDKGWLFEVKWDGYRIIALKKGNSVNLQSRNFKSYNAKFPEIAQEILSVPGEIILDGEVVAVNNKGLPVFQLLQDYDKNENGRLFYYVFDLLYLNGHDLRNLLLKERRKILEKLIKKKEYIKISEGVAGQGIAFFNQVLKMGLEGMIAKNLESIYREGERSKDWLKIKTHLEQEVIIGGYTQPTGGRKFFGSLLLGVYDNHKLKYVGNVGTGFSDQLLKSMREKMDRYKQINSPFSDLKYNKDTFWLRPELVCEIKFQEWTKDNLVRQAVFLGLREDKEPGEVVKE